MPANTLRTLAKLLFSLALSLALTSCGTNAHTIICDAGSNSNCQCGACPINPGPEFLYATSLDLNQILTFSIDHNSGALTTLASAPGPTMSLGLTAVDNQFLYASDSLNAQLDGFSIDQTTGALSALAGSPVSTGPFSIPVGLASAPGANILYAADAGKVDAFNVSATGALAALSGSPFPSGVNLWLTVDPSGKFLYTSDDSLPDGIFAFTIDSTGALTAVPGSPFTVPGQAVPDSQVYGIVDTGSYVYAALLNANQIAAFSIVSGTGALVPVPGSPFSTGARPTALVLASGFLYALNSAGGTISGYSINSENGVLTPLSGSPFGSLGSSMAADFFGQYLFVSGPARIQSFKIDSTSGALAPVAGSPFPASDSVAVTVVQIPPP